MDAVYDKAKKLLMMETAALTSPAHAPLPRAGPEAGEDGDIDLWSVITHTEPMEKGPDLYHTSREKEDGCLEVVLKPGG